MRTSTEGNSPLLKKGEPSKYDMELEASIFDVVSNSHLCSALIPFPF